MIKYATLTRIPSNFKMINKLQSSKSTKDVRNNCQKSFTYFEQSKQGGVQWGSDKPMKETCPVNFKPHTGIPTHSLWNNMTRRKSLIIKE